MGETVQKKLSKKDIIKSYLIWTFFSHSTYNYERMQASGVLHAIAPSLEKLYGKDTQELRELIVTRALYSAFIPEGDTDESEEKEEKADEPELYDLDEIAKAWYDE